MGGQIYVKRILWILGGALQRTKERLVLRTLVHYSSYLTKMYFSDVLAEAVFHSVDPYMRPYMVAYPVGTTMIGGQVAK